jgi:hypothetical protein
MAMIHKLALLILILGIIGMALGGVFVWQGIAKNNLITDRMKIEKVTLALDSNNPNNLTPITDSKSAQLAADKIAADRRAIAPTYQDLLGGGKFDPTNAKELSYAQAMNLENYLYLAVTAFGLIQVVLGTGVYMIIVGLAVFLIGLALYRSDDKRTQSKD